MSTRKEAPGEKAARRDWGERVRERKKRDETERKDREYGSGSILARNESIKDKKEEKERRCVALWLVGKYGMSFVIGTLAVKDSHVLQQPLTATN